MKVYIVICDDEIFAIYKDKRKAVKVQNDLYEAMFKKSGYEPFYIDIEEKELIE